MVVKPMIRSNICINAHPIGCAKDTARQIEYVKAQKSKRGVKSAAEGGKAPKTVLVLGCSTGYGLASRISAAFEYGADTVGVSFEKEASEKKYGTPGWYNNKEFDREAEKAGLKSVTFNADAFSDETRSKVIAQAKDWGVKCDLVIYSLASPVRTDPDTQVLYKSVIKPIGKVYAGAALDMMTGKITQASTEPAQGNEIADTVKVMGGEDWARWMKQLQEADVLSDGCRTVAYSYIGPALSHAIYRDGTIGEAKKDYLGVLFKVMKKNGTHEGCIEQMERLFAERLYTGENNGPGNVPVDSENRIRIDDWEMDPKVQEEVDKIMPNVTEENVPELVDLDGLRHDFLIINGFDVEGVDYEADIADMRNID